MKKYCPSQAQTASFNPAEESPSLKEYGNTELSPVPVAHPLGSVFSPVCLLWGGRGAASFLKLFKLPAVIVEKKNKKTGSSGSRASHHFSFYEGAEDAV